MAKKTQKEIRKKWRIKKNKLAEEAEKIWQIACYKKWGRRCGACGGGINTVHHFFPKGQCGILKYDTDNGVPICISCHFKHHKLSDPTIHYSIIAKRGKEWYNALEEKSKSKRTSFVGVSFYKESIESLTKEIKEM